MVYFLKKESHEKNAPSHSETSRGPHQIAIKRAGDGADPCVALDALADAYVRRAKRIMPSPRHYAALMSMWDFLDRELNSKQGDDWLRPPAPLQPRYALEEKPRPVLKP